MGLFPAAAHQPRPGLGPSIGLATFALLGHLLVLLLRQAAPVGNSLNGLATIMAGALYAWLAEKRVPGALASPSLRWRIAAYAGCLEAAALVPILILTAKASRLTMPWGLTAGAAALIAVLWALFQWVGLVVGEKGARRRREQ